MDVLAQGLTYMTKHVFAIVGAVVLAFLIYILLFVGDNSVLRQASASFERPISQYYYSYVYYPSVHSTEGQAQELGYTISNNVSDLSVDGATSGDTDTASGVSDYTTGWF